MPVDEGDGQVPLEETPEPFDQDSGPGGPHGGEPAHTTRTPHDRVTIAPGIVIQQLEILEEIGRGGMGIVYRARHQKSGKIVAVKVLRPEIAGDPSAGKRLREEAKRAASLDHPRIVDVQGIDVEEPPRFFWMAFINGMSLAEKIKAEGFLGPQEAVDLLVPICEALHYAHDQGVFHGDVKPSNILLKNGTERAMLTDFGIARLRADLPQVDPDGNRSAGGTPGFVAREQAEKCVMDRRTDVYSMGVTLYYALTGQLPCPARPAPSLDFVFKNKTFAPPSRLNRKVSRTLDAVVMKMLATAPDNRYQTCKAAGNYLQAAMGQAIARPVLAAAVTATLLICIVAGIWTWTGLNRGSPDGLAPRSSPTAADRTPFRVTRDGAFASVLDHTGETIYSVQVRGFVAKAVLVPLQSGQPMHLVVGVQGPGEDTGKVMVYDHKGKLVWAAPTYAADEPCPYRGAASNRMTISDLVVGDLWQNGEPCVVTTSNDLDSFQTKVTVFDSRGARKATYWHPGQFQQIKVFKPSQGNRMWILAWGINNYMAAVPARSEGKGYYWGIACLDPETMSGEAPPRMGGFRQGKEVWYTLLLPRGTVVSDVRIRPPEPGGPEGASGQLLQVYTPKHVFLFLDENGKLVRRLRTDASTGDEKVTAEIIP